MTTSFKIHEDPSMSSLGAHEAKTIRPVLGDIQNYNFDRSQLASKKEPFSVYSDSVSSGFIENIKALGLKDKQIFLKDRQKAPNLKVESRSPLKELKNVLKDTELKVEKASTISEEIDKENIGKSLKSPTKDITSDVEEEETEEPVCDESPQISRLELSKTILDNLYTSLDYKDDIYRYLKKMEKNYQPSAYYMRRQPEITHSMRTILVDWLVEVGEEYNLSNDTLFMGVSLIDRFLSVMAITKAKLQLLGTSAMLIASKYEEVYPPEVGAFVYITDDSYTASQVIRMERLILKVLNFDVSNPTLYTFLMHILSYDKIPTKILYLAMYISELTLLQAEPYLEFYPSMIACGAIVLARHCLDYTDIWPSNLVRFTGFTLMQLAPIISHLNETHEKSFLSSHPAIRQKYCSAKYRYVSQIPYRKLVIRDSLSS